MRNLVLALSAVSLAVPAAVVLPTAATAASVSVSKAELQRRSNYRYREWRGRDGRTYCRKSDGTTGLVVGAVGGALVGRTIDTRGDRTGGTVLGAVAGALAGREIDRANSNNRRRCR